MLHPPRLDIRLRIDRVGSLSQAARELGLSYRRAWLLLDDLNHSFTGPVALASVGGVGGGGVQLTQFAKELIAAYREVERAALEGTRARFAGLMKDAEPVKSLKSRLRRLLTRRVPKSRKPGPRSRSTH